MRKNTCLSITSSFANLEVAWEAARREQQKAYPTLGMLTSKCIGSRAARDEFPNGRIG